MNIDDLSRSFLAGGHAVIDLTSHCNLRCTYCHQSRDDFFGSRIEEVVLDRLFDELVNAGISSVRFGTEGEFTMYNGWERYAAFLTANNVSCSYLSNLSRHFSEDQITALAAADQIIVSFDTYNDEVHSRIRRRSQIPLITGNISRIVARGLALGKKPYITQNCVVNAHNFRDVPDIVSRAPDYGIDKVALLFMIKNFTLEDGGLDPIPLDQLSQREQLLSIALVDSAVRLGKSLGVEIALSTILDEKLSAFRSLAA